jgi:hypothetical protein
MELIYDNARLRQPQLREFAFHAACIATVAETVNDLADLLVDLPPDAPLFPDFTTPWPWDVDPMAVARSLVQASRDAAAQKLRHRLASGCSAMMPGGSCASQVDNSPSGPASTPTARFSRHDAAKKIAPLSPASG